LGGSLFSTPSSTASAPPELKEIVDAQIEVTKAASKAETHIKGADTEHEKMGDPNAPIPSPPLHAAQLNSVLKALATAEGAVNDSIKARRSLIGELEKLLNVNRSMLARDESKQLELSRQKTDTEIKKREVEDDIMRGMHGNDSFTAFGSNGNSDGHAVGEEPERPDVEPLSPPSVEALTPTGSPPPSAITGTTTGSDVKHESHSDYTESASAVPAPIHAGSDLLSSLSMPYARQISNSPLNGGMMKKRKLNNDEPEFDGDAMDGLDDEVAAMLRQQSGGL
jgi:regulator of Ty1 transposition protein 103